MKNYRKLWLAVKGTFLLLGTMFIFAYFYIIPYYIPEIWADYIDLLQTVNWLFIPDLLRIIAGTLKVFVVVILCPLIDFLLIAGILVAIVYDHPFDLFKEWVKSFYQEK